MVGIHSENKNVISVDLFYTQVDNGILKDHPRWSYVHTMNVQHFVSFEQLQMLFANGCF